MTVLNVSCYNNGTWFILLQLCCYLLLVESRVLYNSRNLKQKSQKYHFYWLENCFLTDKKRRRKERLQKQQQTEEDLIFERKVKDLEEKIAKADICELFPEFRPNKVGVSFSEAQAVSLCIIIIKLDSH